MWYIFMDIRKAIHFLYYKMYNHKNNIIFKFKITN